MGKTISKSLRLYKLKNWESYWVSDNKQYSNIFFIKYQVEFFVKKIFCNFKNIFILEKVTLKKINNYIYINIYFFPSEFFNIKYYNKKYYKKRYFNNKNKQKKINKKLKKVYKNFKLKFNVLQKIIQKSFIKNNVIKICLIKENFKNVDNFFKKNEKNLLKTDDNNKYNYKHNIKRNNILRTLTNIIILKKIKVFNLYLIKGLQKLPRHTGFLKKIKRFLDTLIQTYPNFLGYKIEFKGRINNKTRSRKITHKKGKVSLTSLKNTKICYDDSTLYTKNGTYGIKTWFFFNN